MGAGVGETRGKREAVVWTAGAALAVHSSPLPGFLRETVGDAIGDQEYGVVEEQSIVVVNLAHVPHDQRPVGTRQCWSIFHMSLALAARMRGGAVLSSGD